MNAVPHDRCRDCDRPLTPETTPPNPNKTGWKCRECIKKRLLKWAKENPDRHKAHVDKDKNKLRAETFGAYGGKCECCGEAQREFLSIDHIEGGGGKHRRELGRVGVGFYRWLRANGWPSGYRVLCYNCNLSLGFFHYCPHQTKTAINPIA